MQDFRFLTILKILRLLQVFVVSLKEAKRTFLTPERTTLKKKIIFNHQVRPQGSCMQNFKFLASQEVLHLLQVLAVSFKEAKRTVLTPERMTLKDKSSLII